MKYFILAGGYGKRAEPLSRFKPKPVFPLDGVPLLARLLDQLQALGCAEGFINLHHLGAQVAAAAAGRRGVRFIAEERLSGSRVLRQARPSVSDWLLAINGDTFMEIPLAAMARRARTPGVDGVLAARPDGSGRYARLRCAGDDLLGSDAPPGLGAGSGLMYAGAALFSGRALEKIDEANFFASIARHGLRFKIVPYDGIWLDIGTPASYLQANCEYRAYAALPPGNSLSAGAVVSPAARVERSLLWEGARIGAGVRLAECIVTQNVELAAGEHVRQIVCPDGVFPIA